nr:MAG TPA: tail component [Caudoviricetes sp.]
MPFLVYQSVYSNNFSADSIVYKKFEHIQIDLYTRFKEPQTEDKVQKALSSFFWEKTEEYDDAERLYRIIYEIEV